MIKNEYIAALTLILFLGSCSNSYFGPFAMPSGYTYHNAIYKAQPGPELVPTDDYEEQISFWNESDKKAPVERSYITDKETTTEKTTTSDKTGHDVLDRPYEELLSSWKQENDIEPVKKEPVKPDIQPDIKTEQKIASAETAPIDKSVATSSNSAFSDKITIDDDPYKSFIEYKSEEYASEDIEENSRSSFQLWALFATKNRKDGTKKYYIQWVNIYSDSDWRKFYKAATDKAQALKYRVVDRDVSSCYASNLYAGAGSCSYSETANIYFPENLLLNSANTGINIKVMAKAHEGKYVHIPGTLITALLKKIGTLQ
jgi:hypothetical protein